MIIEQGQNHIELEISSPTPGSNARRISIGVGCGDFQGSVAETWLESGEFDGFMEDLRTLALEAAGADRSRGIGVLCPGGHGRSSSALAPASQSPAA